VSTPTPCRHCGDDLPADAPPGVDTCKGYARWRARQAGDMLPWEVADALVLYAHFCAMSVAIREGRELLPDVT
jgi:hypothetical protein